MHNVGKVWLAGCLATAATAASTVFNAILAVNNTSNDRLAVGLRILLFVSLGISFCGFWSLIYFTTFYVRNIKRHSFRVKKSILIVLGFGGGIGCAALALPLVVLVWLTFRQHELTKQVLGQNAVVWLAVWYGCWGLATLSHFIMFVILGLWTRQQLRIQVVGRLDIDSGTRLPSAPNTASDEHRSCHSRDTTIAEWPRTPTAKRPDSLSRHSISTKAPVSASRIQLVTFNGSAKSSIDSSYPAGEARSVGSAFDRWDTSTVHSEMRAAVGSPPTTRTELETIPGSRPESPEDALTTQQLSSSPIVARSSSPQAITSDTATALGDWSSSPSRHITSSSPPSSPPNFSRPTSKHKNQAMTAPFESSMQEIIHPLFRASSPQPPPITTSGTMVTASPLANQPITPRTLANLRNHNKSSSTLNSQQNKNTGHWRAMPSISQNFERRPSTSGSQGPSSPPPGSPGPSIADEDELPPILPGFVLSAGQRSSMLGYANRKSVKRDRRESQISTGIAEI